MAISERSDREVGPIGGGINFKQCCKLIRQHTSINIFINDVFEVFFIDVSAKFDLFFGSAFRSDHFTRAHVQVLIAFDIFENNDIAVVNRLAFVTIAVARLDSKDHLFIALGIESDNVAAFVVFSAVFTAFEEVLRVIML